MLYTICKRYEFRSSEGVKWTRWFQLFDIKPTENKEDLKDKLKELKNSQKYVSSKTGGLKSENKIDEYVKASFDKNK